MSVACMPNAPTGGWLRSGKRHRRQRGQSPGGRRGCPSWRTTSSGVRRVPGSSRNASRDGPARGGKRRPASWSHFPIQVASGRSCGPLGPERGDQAGMGQMAVFGGRACARAGRGIAPRAGPWRTAFGNLAALSSGRTGAAGVRPKCLSLCCPVFGRHGRTAPAGGRPAEVRVRLWRCGRPVHRSRGTAGSELSDLHARDASREFFSRARRPMSLNLRSGRPDIPEGLRSTGARTPGIGGRCCHVERVAAGPAMLASPGFEAPALRELAV